MIINNQQWLSQLIIILITAILIHFRYKNFQTQPGKLKLKTISKQFPDTQLEAVFSEISLQQKTSDVLGARLQETLFVSEAKSFNL